MSKVCSRRSGWPHVRCRRRPWLHGMDGQGKPQSWDVFQLLVSEKPTSEPSSQGAGTARAHGEAHGEAQELRARPPAPRAPARSLEALATLYAFEILIKHA